MRLTKNNNLPCITFISTCLIFLLSILLYEWELLNIMNIELHRVTTILIIICILLIPIEAIITFFRWLKYRQKSVGKTNSILNIISAISLITCVCVYMYWGDGIIKGQYTKKFQEYIDKQGDYITIENKRIELSKNYPDSKHYIYLGNGPKATGSLNGWSFRKDIRARCISCGSLINPSQNKSVQCECGKLSFDYEMGRFGSSLGDENIEIYSYVG